VGIVLAVASLHWIAAFVKFRLGVAGENEALTMLSQTAAGLSIFGSMFLTCAIVHLEPIPGVKQDWTGEADSARQSVARRNSCS